MKFALVDQDGTVIGVIKQIAAPHIQPNQDVRPGWLYDGKKFAPAPDGHYKRITSEAFWDRFTGPEIVDLYVAKNIDPAATNPQKKAAARLQIFIDDTNSVGWRNLSKPKVRTWVLGLEGTVLAVGRAAVILDTPITADEAWTG